MVNKLLYQEGCHPAKMFLLPWVQIPLWILISLSLRDISGIFPGCEGLYVFNILAVCFMYYTIMQLFQYLHWLQKAYFGSQT